MTFTNGCAGGDNPEPQDPATIESGPLEALLRKASKFGFSDPEIERLRYFYGKSREEGN